MEIFTIIAIIFFAFLIRSTFGFGDALVAMPLLAIIVSVQIAAPLMAMLAYCMALMILVKNKKTVNFKMSWKLVIAALLGVPVGLLYLSQINEAVVSIVLAIFIISFAIFKLSQTSVKMKTPSWLIVAVGFISGILGGAYNTNGPPVIMLLSAQNWPPKTFRSTLQSYFFFVGTGVVAGHIAWGNVNSQVLKYFFFALPALIIAFFLGEYWFGRFNSEKFYKWVYYLLISIGIGLITKTLTF
ncbi:MAG: sulfite exporter TauE/SafE family protein [Bacteroidales bacterium]|nr:sulfite exporter TauE/SafE family protein [Bacteroidales bacterium]